MDDGGAFDWDEGNEELVLDRGIEPAEVEEALLDEGRIGLRGGKIRPVSVRDANDMQKRRYRKGR